MQDYNVSHSDSSRPKSDLSCPRSAEQKSVDIGIID